MCGNRAVDGVNRKKGGKHWLTRGSCFVVTPSPTLTLRSEERDLSVLCWCTVPNRDVTWRVIVGENQPSWSHANEFTRNISGQRRRERLGTEGRTMHVAWLPRRGLFWSIALLLLSAVTSLNSSTMNRRRFSHRLASLVALVAGTGGSPGGAHAFATPRVTATPSAVTVRGEEAVPATVAYRPLTVAVDALGVTVPVACWFPVNSDPDVTAAPAPTTRTRTQVVAYPHRISIRRIGQLLAGWNFIPDFAARNFALQPTCTKVADGTSVNLPTAGPVVILAHGYLGSRFDLSHLAETLAQKGFTCLSAEYPESLAASYDRVDGLDRRVITDAILRSLTNEWNMQPSSYGIVGHSLGCGTAIQTGDDTWARVLIAGFPRNRDGSTMQGNQLFLASMNDGLFASPRNPAGKQIVPADYVLLEEETLGQTGVLPRRAALVYDRPDAPNHISFLAEGVNDAMIDLLSPLLPLAQALSIPVLDFDRYQLSRDSASTAAIVHPLILRYLQQEMRP